MLKINGKKVWSIGTLKAAARKATARQTAEACTAEEAAVRKTKKSSMYEKYQQKKLENPVVEFIKVDLSEEYFNQSIALRGREVIQCEHCKSVTFEGHKHLAGKSGILFACPKCGKVSPIWPHNSNAILIPSYMTVKKYQDGSVTVNCFAIQYVVYVNKDRLFLAKNKGVGQVIFAKNGQTYVKPFRDLKSGRALHTAAGTATKAEARRYENITYQGDSQYTYHYTGGEYNFYEDYIRILEDRGIIPYHAKLAHRFPYLDKKDVVDLSFVQEKTSNINWYVSGQKPVNMWNNALKKKIGTLPRSITSEELAAKVVKYYKSVGYGRTFKSYHNIESLLLLFLFKRLKSNDIELLMEIHENHDFDYLARTLEPDLDVRKHLAAKTVNEYYSATTRMFDEEVPW